MKHTVDFIRERCDVQPEVAIILGSGLGGVADKIESTSVVDYADIPGFVASTAGGHRGQLILGTIEGVPVVAMAGRLHRYEGHSCDTITRPVVTMARLGAETLIVSNAAGGLNPNHQVGDLVAIEDHIDWIGGHFGDPNKPNRTGAPARSGVYDPQLIDLACHTGLAGGFTVHRGTYLATTGPTYETRAEYRMMRRIGADLAGMSTVPEAMAAAAAGMKVLAISMVSNVANPDQPVAANHDEVLAAGQQAAVKMEHIVRSIVRIGSVRCNAQQPSSNTPP